MRNIVFVIWMLGFPLVGEFCLYLAFKRGRIFESEVLGVAAMIDMVIWIFVGYKLYERESDTTE